MNFYSKIIILTTSILCFSSCMGTDEAELAGKFLPPQVAVGEATISNESTTVVLNASYKQSSSSTVIDEVGFYYGDNSELTSAEKLVARTSNETFSVKVLPNTYGKEYFYKAYLSNGKSEILSSVKSFTMPGFENFVTLDSPKVITASGNDVSISATFSKAEGVTLSEAGVFYSSDSDVTIDDTKVTSSNTETINVEIKGLSTGIKYYMRSYVMDREYIAFSETVEIVPHAVPSLTTVNVSDISYTSAVSGGISISDNGLDITSKGVVWSTEANPTIELSTKTENGVGKEDFIAVISGLTPGKRYYVRAYAINSVGVGYGNEITFETDAAGEPYIDEYGINQGWGVKIGETVWAPVNCGYHKDDFKYGKLYQWGRNYGQGYDGGLYDVNGKKVGEVSDATVPAIEDGGISAITGQHKNKANVFFTSTFEFNYDWLYPSNDKLWNSGSESNPVKTEYDPCPEGWRVPTYAELDELSNNCSSWTTNENGQPGYWFSGASSYRETVPQVFLPAAGLRDRRDGDARDRGDYGGYWSSGPDFPFANCLGFHGSYVYVNGNRADGYSVRCVQDDSVLIPVESITLNKKSLTLSVFDSEALSITILPSNANHQYAYWWSDNPEIASVDQNGNVAGVSGGATIIYAMAGMQVATCSVTVTGASNPGDYIDEYGINHGPGVKIGETIWAPVNCGYKAATSESKGFPYGKLYQWGRKYGQGYKESYDESVPELVEGPVMPSVAQSGENKDKFYYASESPNNWSKVQQDDLWNSGTESAPVKTKYDPCPEGWRVPTYGELDELDNNYSSWTTDDNGQSGRWFSGPNSYTATVPRVFLPAAGYRDYYDGSAANRGYYGGYWSSGPYGTGADRLGFRSSDVYIYIYYRAGGYSVRCVQE